MTRDAMHPAAIALGVALLATACTTSGEQPAAPTGITTIEGTIVSVDTKPWAYDGHAVVQVDVGGRRWVSVQLPARWNLCKAQPVDVQALAVGKRVQAIGEAEGADTLVVCAEPSHRLILL